MRGAVLSAAGGALCLAALLAAVRFGPAPAGVDQGAGRTVLSALGIFRVFAVDALWIRMQAHRQQGQDGLVLSDARALLELEPDSEAIRDFLHWHLAFNMANRALSDEARAAWFEEGLEVQEEGLRRNPDSALLQRGLGMTFFMVSGGEGVYRAVCRRRYGLRPVELAPRCFERAWRLSGDLRTLGFFLASLANAAEFAAGEKRWEEAAGLYRRAAAYAAQGLSPASPGSEAARMIALFEEEAAACRRAAEEAAPSR